MDARTGDFKNSAADLSRSGASQTFKFERQDWALFRTAEGLSQKAGVPKHKLPRLVMKELADNGLDEGGQVRVGKLPDEAGYFVEDSGRGIDPAEVPRLFCISRPLVSTKLLRLPTRGALGNGLRVVAGAVLASTGTLCVITRNRRIELRPEYDGTTTVVRTTEVDFPTGARVEINFGPALPASDPTPVLAWAEFACAMAEGKVYAGRSSPHWYDGPQFFELINAAGERPVREVIAELDGCTGATAGKIVETAKLNRAVCKDINQEQATVLLEAARVFAKPVTAKRLGAVGGDLLPQRAYAVAYGFVEFGTEKPLAQIPFVVECWAEKVRTDTRLMMCVNRTPITGVVDIDRNKREINAFGCGLRHTIAQAPVEAQFSLLVNLITPFVPITSDGKEPDLEPFLDEIETAVGKAVRKAHRPTAKGRVSIKDVVFNHLEDIIADVSKNGTFEFNPRHLLYPLRPVVQNEIGKELSTENFNSILTDYENEFGEIPGMYREPRGSIRHPHTREKIELSTRSVEEYERPPWLYNKVISIEKEGFDGTFAKTHFQERYDCTITSSKGFIRASNPGTRRAQDQGHQPRLGAVGSDRDGPRCRARASGKTAQAGRRLYSRTQGARA
jgi:hypothetical protein